MGKRKAHSRTLARARQRREQERLTLRRRRRLAVGGSAAVLALVLGTAAAGLLGRTGAPEPAPTAPATAACGAERPAAAGVAKPTFDAPPETVIDPQAHSYRARLVTSCGDITVELFADRAPATVNNFVFLAREDFFDGLTFHRVVPGFVVQGGDPVGDGTGGPGYRFPDELDVARSEGYRAGSLAMANSGPDSNGSQFFIVLEGGAGQLTADYSLFGQVVDGMEVAERIAGLPLDGQAPRETVYIADVIVEETPR